jgi:hypothetical protein
MCDYNSGTTNVEAAISIAHLIFIDTFYNNVLYVLMHIYFYDVQHCTCIFVISRNLQSLIMTHERSKEKDRV